DFSGRNVSEPIELWSLGAIVSSSLSNHRRRVAEWIEELAKKFVTDWNLDNQDKGQKQDWPGPDTKSAPRGDDPWAEFTLQPAPIPAQQHEIANVKYRGPVDLAPFKCDSIGRSSFIQRVCYDEKNAYMLINLSGTWYHYYEIDPATVSSLLAAPSMGHFFDYSI